MEELITIGADVVLVQKEKTDPLSTRISIGGDIKKGEFYFVYRGSEAEVGKVLDLATQAFNKARESKV